MNSPTAVNSENGILMDIFVNGHNSQYFNFFYVDWGHPAYGWCFFTYSLNFSIGGCEMELESHVPILYG
jgi:hypothetical protein